MIVVGTALGDSFFTIAVIDPAHENSDQLVKEAQKIAGSEGLVRHYCGPLKLGEQQQTLPWSRNTDDPVDIYWGDFEWKTTYKVSLKSVIVHEYLVPAADEVDAAAQAKELFSCGDDGETNYISQEIVEVINPRRKI